jgi:DNA repair exonuclease SbcCD ATPase subunit
MKITKLDVKNVMRIEALSIAPNGESVVIGGENGAGKSSVLNAIQMAFGGGRASAAEPMRKGAKSAQIVCETETYIVTRRWTKSGNTTLEVVAKDGSKIKKPQELLDSLFGSLTFDPLAFARMDARGQREALMRLVGLDFAAEDAKRSVLFDRRTDVNREVKRLTGALDKAPQAPPGTPDSEVSVADLSTQLVQAQEANAALARGRADLEAKRARASKIKADIAALTAELATITAEGKGLAAQLEGAVEVDLDPIRKRITNADDINRSVRAKAQRATIAAQLNEVAAQAEAITGEIEAIDQSKAAAAAAAKYPVAGLEVTDDGVRLAGVPFAQASQAEQLRASVAIGAAASPELRVMLVRDGALLDASSMALLAEIAAEHDIQTWTEVVGNRDECTLIIADGHVAEVVGA